MVFRRVTIVGLGLIGGSLGMAIRKRRLASSVVGFSRRASTLRRAKRRGAIDVGMADAREAVEHADLVILAVPVDAVVSSGVSLARWMRPGSILTDVGSTKTTIVSALERRMPRHVHVVGAHPLAGSEQRGIDAAQPRLFNDALCIVTPTSRTHRGALQQVTRLWQLLGSRVVTMSPVEHDRVLGATSHLPHLLAYTLMHTTGAPRVAAPSFLQMTRIAKSDPALWDDIVFANRPVLLRLMRQFDREWHTLQALLSHNRRTALRRFLAHAKAQRDALKEQSLRD